MGQAEQYSFESYDVAQEAYFERGWTDGLPVVPPTPEKVERFLDYAGLGRGDVLGSVPTREVTVTAEQAAINGVMAGCKAEYFPVIVAALRALTEEKGNFHSTTGTLTGAAQTVIVNGPIRTEIDINCKAGCFGPGWRANATIGRALRLVVRNVGRSIPGFLDRATFSTPARYSFCFGENEEDSPWVPLQVERGFTPDTSTVTVASCKHVSSAGEVAKKTPEATLDSIVTSIRRGGVSGDRWLGQKTNVVVVVGMEHMRVLSAGGWSKKDMRDYAYPRLMEPQRNGEARVNLGEAEGLLFVAAGGPGMPESWIIHPHLSWAITKPIETPERGTGR